MALSRLVLVIAACKLGLHLYTNRSYGYFIDELYYLACAEHLDWGYVDQPPLIALIARLARTALGDSLPAIRLLPALAGAGKVVLTGLIARELGGGRFAQALAALCVLFAPGFLAIDNWLSMNAFEPLFWMGCAWLILRMINTGDQRLWIPFGVLAGLGLENKHSMLIFGFGLIAGLMFTPGRRLLHSRYFWVAAALALAIFLPNLLWNVQHQFPFLELQANIRRSGRNVELPLAAFVSQEALAMLPVSLPVWLAGLWFFFSRQGVAYRAMGWGWVIAAALIFTLNPRIYYLFPAFPVLFAAGAVMIERWRERRPRWIGNVYCGSIIVVGIVCAPMAIPVLPVETFLAYSKALKLEQPRIENRQLAALPQLYADQFGWREMAESVAAAYHRLPPEVRARTAIFGQNYGQAGAIDLFGPSLGLPKAISGHQNYFLWGPRDYTGESVLVMGDREERLKLRFESVEKVATVRHAYSMPSQNFDVHLCRGLKQPLAAVWPQLKNWF